MCELMWAWFPLNAEKLWEQEPVVLRVVLTRPRAYGNGRFLRVVSVWWFIMKNSAFIFTAVTNLNPLVVIVSRMLQALIVYRLFVEWSTADLVYWISCFDIFSTMLVVNFCSVRTVLWGPWQLGTLKLTEKWQTHAAKKQHTDKLTNTTAAETTTE